MKLLLLVVGAAVVIAAAVLWIRSHVAPEYSARVGDISRVLASLSASTADPAFAVFLLHLPGAADGSEELNLQFSLEDGHAGFDWVLLSPWNIRDEVKFTEFARTAGYAPVTKEMNGVRYLRVDDGDIAALCRDVILKLYQWPESEPMDLIVEGFVWSPAT